MDSTEEKIVARLKEALAKGDVATLQYMLSFTANFYQMADNIKTYEKYLACGYTDKPSFDEYGWIDNYKKVEANAEKISVFEDGSKKLTVEVLQLANSKWVSGIDLMLAESGCLCGASIWNKQYNTRHEAYMAACETAMKDIQSSSNKNDKKYISYVKKKMAESLQLSLF